MAGNSNDSGSNRDRTSKKYAAKTSTRARIAAQREAQQRSDRRRNLLVTGGTVAGVVAVIAIIVGIGIATSHSKSSKNTAGNAVLPAASTVTTAITKAATQTSGIPDGSSIGPPTAIKGAALTAGGKPEVLYIGAEYCPYCAATRWPLAVALSRFGTFSNLKTTYSSDTDTAGPHTPTLSFYQSSYSSSYIDFVSKEHADGLGNPLQSLTSAENKLFSGTGGGSYPFIDFGGQWMQHGSSFDPTILKGMTPESVAAALSDTSSTQGKTISAGADVFTAAICKIDGNKPANVCSAQGVTSAATALTAAK